jgi:glutamate synthase (NADPH/NADH) large chain
MHRLIARHGSRRHASSVASSPAGPATIKDKATQSFRGLPKDKGLYRNSLEKDSCGVGMMAHLKAKPSHNIVASANTMLARMSHRGGCGCEKNTGDGAGILLATPDGFMRNTAAASIPELAARGGLPEFGQYGMGNVFFSHDAEAQKMCRLIFDKHAKVCC